MAFLKRFPSVNACGEKLEPLQRRWEQSIGPGTGSYNRPVRQRVRRPTNDLWRLYFEGV